jgi:hypothetical protein
MPPRKIFERHFLRSERRISSSNFGSQQINILDKSNEKQSFVLFQLQYIAALFIWTVKHLLLEFWWL